MNHQVKSSSFDHFLLWLMVDVGFGLNGSLIRRFRLLFAETAIKRPIVLVDRLQQVIHSFCWLVSLPFQHVFFIYSMLFLSLSDPLDIDYLLHWFFVLILARRGWTFLLLGLRLRRMFYGRFDLLYIWFLLVFFSAMNLQNTQILACMIVITKLARRQSKELNKRVNVSHLAMMFGLVHLSVLQQYFLNFLTVRNVLVANDADQDMQKYDILCVFKFLILVLQQFAVLCVDLAQQILVDKQGNLAEVQRRNLFWYEGIGQDDFDAWQLQFQHFSELKELKRCRVFLSRLFWLEQRTGHFHKSIHADNIEILAVSYSFPELTQQVKFLRFLKLTQLLRVSLIMQRIDQLRRRLPLVPVKLLNEIKAFHERGQRDLMCCVLEGEKREEVIVPYEKMLPKCDVLKCDLPLRLVRLLEKAVPCLLRLDHMIGLLDDNRQQIRSPLQVITRMHDNSLIMHQRQLLSLLELAQRPHCLHILADSRTSLIVLIELILYGLKQSIRLNVLLVGQQKGGPSFRVPEAFVEISYIIAEVHTLRREIVGQQRIAQGGLLQRRRWKKISEHKKEECRINYSYQKLIRSLMQAQTISALYHPTPSLYYFSRPSLLVIQLRVYRWK